MDLGFLKIITDGIKKTIEAYRSLDDAMTKREKEKLDEAERARLEETAKILRNFSVEGTYERVSLTISFIPAVSNYLDEPTAARWQSVKQCVGDSMDGLSRLSQTLYKNADIFGSKDFFEPILESIVHRRAILNQLYAMPQPETRAEIREVDGFLQSYNQFMQTFAIANGELRHHIESILEKKPTPQTRPQRRPGTRPKRRR